MSFLDAGSSIEKVDGDVDPSFFKTYQNHIQDILFAADQEKVLIAVQCFRTLSASEGKNFCFLNSSFLPVFSHLI
jgi:hypothetical protein